MPEDSAVRTARESPLVMCAQRSSRPRSRNIPSLDAVPRHKAACALPGYPYLAFRQKPHLMRDESARVKMRLNARSPVNTTRFVICASLRSPHRGPLLGHSLEKGSPPGLGLKPSGRSLAISSSTVTTISFPKHTPSTRGRSAWRLDEKSLGA